MKKSILKLTLLTLAVALLGTPAVIRAQDASSNAPATTAPAGKKQHGLPVHGKIAAIDTTANTVTIGKLTLNITEKTKIKKSGAVATISDLTVGDLARGFYKKDAEGKLNLTTLTIGAKKAAASTEAAPAAAAPAAGY